MEKQVFISLSIEELKSLIISCNTGCTNEKVNTQTEGSKDRLLTVEEAGKFLSLAVPTIYSKVSRGELPFMKRSKRLYFSKEDLMEYVKGGRRKTNIELEAEVNNYLKK